MVLMSGPAWQQCHAARRSSGVRRAVAMPALGKGREWASLLPLPCPIPLDEVVGFVGVAGRLPKAGFSGSRPLDSAVSGQLAALPSTPQEAALCPGVLRGTACPDVLKGSGARVGLPVAHYSDSSPRNR